MFLLYLLWGVFLFCSLFMGWSAFQTLNQQGFAWNLFLNTVLYLGIALYSLPKFLRLVFKRG